MDDPEHQLRAECSGFFFGKNPLNFATRRCNLAGCFCCLQLNGIIEIRKHWAQRIEKFMLFFLKNNNRQV